MSERGRVPPGLALAWLRALLPLAVLSPLPLIWTDGASRFGILLYECAILFLGWRARAGRMVRLSDWSLNAAGAVYFLWLGFELTVLHPGLLRAISHLLFFLVVAKLGSLKRPGEAATALLVLFAIALASASTSTNVVSLLYVLAMGIAAFRALAAMAVLADFDGAPPERVLRGFPTPGMVSGAVFAGAILTVPLFYALPRLSRPFVVPRVRFDEAFSTTLSADRVDLTSFGAAKRSDRTVLRMDFEPRSALPRVARLREAVFTEYKGGVWTRRHISETPEKPSAKRSVATLAERAQQLLVGTVDVDLTPAAEGYLFLPYGAEGLKVEGEFPVTLPDGVVRLAGNHSVHYTLGVRGLTQRGEGATAIDPRSIPSEIRDYAQRLTGDLSAPAAIYERIRTHLARNFLYTLDPPRGPGDPLVNFLTHSKAGHCEFFASATAMMLAARNIPSRLVTGSYGGEVGLFSSALVVRAANLHAWVEADLDGEGFSALDPTPPAGIPPAETRLSWNRMFSNLGHELEFFYDRRILGFDMLDQVQFLEAARRIVSGLGRSVFSWKEFVRSRDLALAGVAALALGLFASALLLGKRLRLRASAPSSTRAYLTLRRLLSRRLGPLSSAVPPLAVARLFENAVPEGSDDAHAVVSLYCASAFGGRPIDRETERELQERVRRLKKLA